MHDGTPTQVELALLLARRQKVKDDAFAAEVNRRGIEIADEIDEQIAFAEETLRGLLIERERFAGYKRQQSQQPPPQRNFPREQAPPARIVAKAAAAAE